MANPKEEHRRGCETTNAATDPIPGSTKRRYLEALSNLVTNYAYN